MFTDGTQPTFRMDHAPDLDARASISARDQMVGVVSAGRVIP
jgi:hypothetical protein